VFKKRPNFLNSAPTSAEGELVCQVQFKELLL